MGHTTETMVTDAHRRPNIDHQLGASGPQGFTCLRLVPSVIYEVTVFIPSYEKKQTISDLCKQNLKLCQRNLKLFKALC